MIEYWTVQERQKIISETVKRAATDPEFRSLALHDPNTALQQIAGKPLPPSMRIRVLEQEHYDLTCVLPDPASASGDVSDAELDQVAGGDGWPFPPDQWP